MLTHLRVYTGEQCRELDQIAISKFEIPALTLMHRAGRFAADTLIHHWCDAEKIAIFCGSGNNAGDGYVLAGILRNRGLAVQVRQIGNIANLTPDADAALHWMHEQGIEISDVPCDQADVVVDALLGTGVNGELRGNYAEAVEHINKLDAKVLALDVPSGIHAGTGGTLTDRPVVADVTATFVGRKVGLYTGAGVDHAGHVEFSDLGVSPEAYGYVEGIPVIPTCTAEQALPQRTRGSHKNQSGHVLVLGGNLNTGGAAILSAEGALRTGAGLVSVVTRAEHVNATLARLPEVMVAAFQENDDISQFLDRADVVVVGPGLGQNRWSEQLLEQALDSNKPIVIDADALNLLAVNSVSLPGNVVLTPHPGEAARLLKSDTATVSQDRLKAAQQISDRFGATVILKGAGTILARNGEIHGICDRAHPALGTAGSGDVLAGVVGTCRAQVNDDLNAATLGVWLHVQAGIRAAESSAGYAISSSDIAKALRPWN